MLAVPSTHRVGDGLFVADRGKGITQFQTQVSQRFFAFLNTVEDLLPETLGYCFVRRATSLPRSATHPNIET